MPLAAAAGLLLLVLVRLGASLMGLRVFAGLDLLTVNYPWTDGTVPSSVVENPLIGDTIDSLLPSLINLHQRLLGGDVPMWIAAGAPGNSGLGTNTLGWATPLTIWSVILPTAWTMGFVKLLQLVAAFAFMVLWLRRIGASTGPAAFAGLAYCGSGFFVAWSNWIPQATSAALLPLLFWSVERFVQLRTVQAVLAIPVSVAFLFLAGFPAVAGHGLYAAGAYFLVRLFAEGVRPVGATVRAIGLAAAGVVTGLALAAFQLLPLLGWLGTSNLEYREDQFHLELPWRSLLTVVLPTTFNPEAYPDSNPIESYAFLGAGVVMLAALAVLCVRFAGVRRGVVSFLAVGIVFVGAVIWFQGWWTDWLGGLPIFSGNMPGRLRDLIGLFGCALAGIGGHVLLRTDLPRTSARWRGIAGSGLVGTLIVALSVLWVRTRDDAPNPAHLTADVALGLGCVVLLGVAVLAGRRQVLRSAAVGLATLVLAVQIVGATAFYWPTGRTADFYPENGLIDAAQHNVGHDRALQLSSFFGSAANAYDLRTATAHTFQPDSWRAYMLAIDPRAYSPPGRTPTSPRLTLDMTGRSIDNPLLDRLGARWIIGSPTRAVPGPVTDPDRTSASFRGSDQVALTQDGLTVRIDPGPIRGVRLYVDRSVRSTVRLEVTVLDELGRPLATGSAARGSLDPGWLTVPVAGEDLPTTGTQTVRIVAGTAPVTLSATGTVPSVQLIGIADDGLRLAYSDQHGVLWERTAALPRIRWASQSRVIPTQAARLTALESASLPSDTVVLDEHGSVADGRPATVSVDQDTGDVIRVRVDAHGAGYLVVAESLGSGWSASVDGTTASIRAADQAFSGVAVPEGAHEVVFEQVGVHRTAGNLISAAALAASLTCWALLVVRRRGVPRRNSSSNGPTPG